MRARGGERCRKGERAADRVQLTRLPVCQRLASVVHPTHRTWGTGARSMPDQDVAQPASVNSRETQGRARLQERSRHVAGCQAEP